MSPADSKSSRPDKSSGRRPAGRLKPQAGGRSHGDATTHRDRQSVPARSQGFDLIYGRNPVREALRGKRAVRRIYLAAGTVGSALEQSVTNWASAAGKPVPARRVLTPDELRELAGTSDHQGIVAEVEVYPYVEPGILLQTHTLLVALDEIQDPHNLGAIIRTAEGAGAGVVITRHRAAEITAAVVKASAGATEHASVSQVRNLADFLAEAKQAGFWVYGTAAEAESDYTGQDYSYPTCFVMGSEGPGLGKRVASLCDVMVSLPLAGQVDSLNVSVSAGILLYEAVRQRRQVAPAEPGGGDGE